LLLVMLSMLLMYLLCYYSHMATPMLSTLSLHDALPISELQSMLDDGFIPEVMQVGGDGAINVQWYKTDYLFITKLLLFWLPLPSDRKSTRLNSSHVAISYAVFCLKKKIKDREYVYTHTA